MTSRTASALRRGDDVPSGNEVLPDGEDEHQVRGRVESVHHSSAHEGRAGDGHADADSNGAGCDPPRVREASWGKT